MNEVKLFDFENNKMRTQEIDNQIYFCLKDVCDILEIDNVSQCKTRLNKGGVSTNEVGVQTGFKKDGTPAIQKVKMTFINESNLYKVIFQSRKPQAERFTEWVTSEVLPTLRKTGSYQMPTNPMQALELMFQALKETNDGVTQIEKRVTEIEENAPLTPSEYSMLCRKINERIRTIKHERGLEHLNREQQSELYRSINRDIKTVTGVQVRSQIRQKALSRVLEFVYDWEPSKATLYTIQQIPLDL